MESPLDFVPCIGTLNLTVRQNLFGVPPSGGPDRLKPGHQTVGSWEEGTFGGTVFRIRDEGFFRLQLRPEPWPSTADFRLGFSSQRSAQIPFSG